MRILLAVHGYPPRSASGAERQTARMAEWLLNHGHDPEVFALESLTANEVELVSQPHEGVVVHRLNFDLEEIGSQVERQYTHPRISEAFRRVLAERPRFDVVHVVSGYWLGNQVIREARAQGLPVVVSLMEFWFMCAQLNLMHPSGTLCSGPESDGKCARCIQELSRRYRVPAEVSPAAMEVVWKLVQWTPANRRLHREIAGRRLALREALGLADQVISNSQFLLDKFTEAGFDTRRFMYLRQGLPDGGQSREPHSRHEGTLRLGYLGQVKFHKGVDLLVDAVADLIREGAALSLDVWGPTHEEPAFVEGLRARTEKLGGIRWCGVYPGDRSRDVLRDLDVVVVPSRWNENSPNVILEAYDMGLPVVATKLGGMAELVDHGSSGLVFGLNDGADLRRQLRRLLAEPGLYERLQAGVPVVRSVDHEMEDVVSVYRRVLAGVSNDTGPSGPTAPARPQRHSPAAAL